MKLLLALGLLLMLGACDTDADPIAAVTADASRSTAVELSTGSWRVGDDVVGGAVGGVLRVDAAGCLFYRQVGKFNIAWPADYTARRTFDGGVDVLNPDGEVVARTGQEFAAKGEIFPTSSAPVPMSCLANREGVVVVIQDRLPVFADWHTSQSHVVTLYHCGVNPTRFEGREWQVPDKRVPFASDDPPKSFIGRGTMTSARHNEAVYVDESGVRLVFRPAEKVPDSFCM